jgi:hypothetical protein
VSEIPKGYVLATKERVSNQSSGLCCDCCPADARGEYYKYKIIDGNLTRSVYVCTECYEESNSREGGSGND